MLDITVSFDFDGTLDRKDIQAYALECINMGVNVIVCTFRIKETPLNPTWNDDLYQVCEMLGIKDIIYTHGEDKSKFLPPNVLWHLDDDWTVMTDLQKNTKITPISCFGSGTWKRKCDRLIAKRI